MKIILLITVLLIGSVVAQSQSQIELTEISSKNMRFSETKMNKLFAKILKVYSSDSLFTKSLKKSQLAWKTYLKCQVEAMFPKYSEGYYGSMLPMCVTSYKKKLIDLRISELQEWLNGAADGDCLTSIKQKSELSKEKR